MKKLVCSLFAVLSFSVFTHGFSVSADNAQTLDVGYNHLASVIYTGQSASSCVWGGGYYADRKYATCNAAVYRRSNGAMLNGVADSHCVYNDDSVYCSLNISSYTGCRFVATSSVYRDLSPYSPVAGSTSATESN